MPENTELANNNTDRMVVLAKITASFIPGVGSSISELVNYIIPRQRMDRIEAFLHRFNTKVESLGDRIAACERLKEPPYVDLFEDAMFSASRATAPERIKYLAAIVGNALSPEHVDALRHKRLLWLIDQLDDAEIIMLYYYTYAYDFGDAAAMEYRERHKDILDPPPLYAGLTGPEYKAASEAHSIHDAYLSHLKQLNLLYPEFETSNRGTMPVFDLKTGTTKVRGHYLTPLGVMLLRQMDFQFTRADEME